MSHPPDPDLRQKYLRSDWFGGYVLPHAPLPTVNFGKVRDKSLVCLPRSTITTARKDEPALQLRLSRRGGVDDSQLSSTTPHTVPMAYTSRGAHSSCLTRAYPEFRAPCAVRSAFTHHYCGPAVRCTLARPTPHVRCT